MLHGVLRQASWWARTQVQGKVEGAGYPVDTELRKVGRAAILLLTTELLIS